MLPVEILYTSGKSRVGKFIDDRELGKRNPKYDDANF
ncbi:hypothetical protein Bandiella_00815 [Candidatus Bandiella woodruffii]|uniref:Uncharacterized protein n=1 Tax=Candidatus Bandiella euplotis TaxID=1664265 RepID=A0ABZ0URN4_9RICK|nr:hypothetical protein Bandiella_00815 [Candidatus Bandiella woodruffii]